MPRRALILSSSADAENFGGVARSLRDSGFVVAELLSDELLSAKSRLRVELRDGAYRVELNGDGAFGPEKIEAAWWRKPQWTRVVRDDAAQRLSLELELERMHLALASLVPDEAWLNSPDAMRAAESKLRQLRVAAELGFRCPHSLVTNDWATAREVFGEGKVVFKALRGGIRSEGEDRIVFTQPVELERFEGSSAALPYPGMLQRRIARRKEWRVTVVGAEVFPVAVYAPADGVDWRRDQLRGLARFASEKLDPEAEEALVLLAARLGLRYAAIDLIEEPDGSLVFLEINPNGQYSWLERELGLPISAAIASVLAG